MHTASMAFEAVCISQRSRLHQPSNPASFIHLHNRVFLRAIIPHTLHSFFLKVERRSHKCRSWKMHTCQCQSVFFSILQELRTRLDSFFLIHVKRRTNLRMPQLERSTMNQITYNQELACLINCMSQSMPHRLQGNHFTRKRIAKLKEMQTILVCLRQFLHPIWS